MPSKLAVCVLAEGVALDQITGRITAFNILDAIRSKSVPAMLPKLMVLNTYESDGVPDAFVERVTISAPNGAKMAEAFAEITIAGPAHNSIHALWALRFDEFGAYEVSVARAETRDGKWRTIAGRRLVLVDLPHPQWAADGQPKIQGGGAAITE